MNKKLNIIKFEIYKYAAFGLIWAFFLFGLGFVLKLSVLLVCAGWNVL